MNYIITYTKISSDEIKEVVLTNEETAFELFEQLYENNKVASVSINKEKI